MALRQDDLGRLGSLLGVAAELLAHSGEDFVGEVGLATGTEALVERGGQYEGRHRLVDGGLYRPAALA